MKIAVSARGAELSSEMDPRFGRASFFVVFDDETNDVKVLDNQAIGNSPNSAGVQASQAVIDGGVHAVISGNCGPNAFRALSASNITVYTCKGGTVQEALDEFKAGSLKAIEGANVQGHWGM